MVRQCGMAERSVQYIPRGLEKDGAIEIQQEARGKLPRVYRIHLARCEKLYPLSQAAADQAESDAEIAPQEQSEKGCRNCIPRPKGVQIDAQRGATQCTPNNT